MDHSKSDRGKSYELRIQRASAPPDVLNLLRGHSCPVLPTGTHFLVSSSTGLPFEPFISFLSATALTRSLSAARLTRSPRTIEAFASDLSDFFGYLDARNLRWEDVDVAALHRYIDTMIERPSPVTGRPYADMTIRRRISTVKSFYGWARSRGRTRYDLSLLDASPEIRSRHIGGPLGELATPPAPAMDREVRPIPPEHLRRIFAELGPLPYLKTLPSNSGPSKASPITLRNRLMAECGLQSGLRRAEIAELSTAQFLDCQIDVTAPFILHPIRIFGKGARWRTVNFPTWLVEALQVYIREFRSPDVDTSIDKGHLFVRHERSRAKGNRVSVKLLNEVFSRACIRAGFTKRLPPVRSSDCDRVVAAYVVHALRHSFAITTYFARKQQGDPEPWLYIQSMLGHAFLETTLKIYLKITRALESEYADHFLKMQKALVAKHA